MIIRNRYTPEEGVALLNIRQKKHLKHFFVSQRIKDEMGTPSNIYALLFD